MKLWKLRPQVSDDLEKQLLFSRGISDDQKRSFFAPNYETDCYDPFKMKGMERAVQRILRALEKDEKIALFGDYDVDGVCGAAIFYSFFKKIGFKNFEVYIPDRYKEGYGLNLEAVEYFGRKGVNLIITIDCGISDYEEVKKAKSLGIDTIILDHHLPPKEVPPAVAIVDLRQENESYPFKDLCGAGVAFKTLKAVLEAKDFNIIKGWEKWLLDLVCLATIADMVPLKDENRVLVFYGFKVFKKTQRIGLLDLMASLQIQRDRVNEDDISFLLAPRINAASRMDHTSLGFELLVNENPEKSKWLVRRINEKMTEQKKLIEDVFQEAKFKISTSGLKDDKVLVLGSENWLPPVLGIVATKLRDEFGKDVFIWGRGDGEIYRGSARGGGEVNLVELMGILGDEFFLDYGGHSLAAGFTLKKESLEMFAEAVKQEFEKIGGEKQKEILWIDKKIELDDINWDLLSLIDKFRPFGIGNERPLFLLEKLKIERLRCFGNGGQHFQIDFKKDNGETISAVGFYFKNNNKNNNLNLQEGSFIDLVASIERSFFKGYEEIKLRIVDLKYS